jgi:hypothetical protein
MVDLIFAPPDFFHPALSVNVQAFMRTAYGVLMVATLLITLPNPRFFLSERWGGYSKSARDVDLIQRPSTYPIVMTVWLGANLAIMLGQWSVWASLVNLLLCRYFFVYMRWKGVARGMGAPGFMTYWMGLGIFLLEYSLHYAPDLRSLVVLTIQIDFAFIMFSAGYYKLRAGYAHKQGMELGMANPQWAFWPKFYLKRPPEHWSIQLFNQLAWSMEIGAAILILIPPLRFIGGLLILLSFAFLTTQIRLGWLAQLVMVCTAVLFHPGSIADRLMTNLHLAPSTNPSFAVPDFANILLAALLWGYLILLPFAHAGLFYNFYRRKHLPTVLQAALERYTNFFGLIIWRVFSSDHVNFYIMIYHAAKGGERNRRTLISRYGWTGGGLLNRFNHVGESIVITTLFTTLKYYPSNNSLFQERLLRYARTLPCPAGHELVFEYISLGKDETKTKITETALAEYWVDPAAGTVAELVLSEHVSVRATIDRSPVHEAAHPGSYAPVRR